MNSTTLGGRAPDDASNRKAGHKRANLFWGRLAQLDLSVRIAILVFVVAAIVSMSFSQLGFWSIGEINGDSVYLMLILGPLVMGALLFGPYTGTLLGLFTGVVVYSHALFIPLDNYEVNFMTPLNTFVLLTVLGAFAGVLFKIVLRNNPQGGKRIAFIAVICLMISLIASGLVTANVIFEYGGLEHFDQIRDFLLINALGSIVQIAIDAALMVVLCCAADAIVRALETGGKSQRLLTMFRAWMVLISLVTFMVVSAGIFTAATLQEQDMAVINLKSEIGYLERQLESQKNLDIQTLIDGYTVALDGSVAIADANGIIVATNDSEKFPIGRSFQKCLGYDEYDSDFEFANIFDEVIEAYDGASIIQTYEEDGSISPEFSFIATGKYHNGYIGMLYTSEKVYDNRFSVMVSSTLLALVLILAMNLVATTLLNHVVIRRIDDTNASLKKITAGDLTERVSVHDSREFTSLASGINTTVSALKDSIAEAEQKNAQELATAKAIQESVLPREFPPFPDIDRFDIYASMKTAREVGGDFYDFFLLEGDKLGFVMADVSGKGIPAALFMMTAKTQIRNYMEAGLPIGEAINAANHQLCIGNDAGMFVTVLACILDYQTGELSYVNAGHNPPLVLHRGTWEWMREVSGMPLGLFDDIPYDPLSHKLDEGDMLYLYTDGVTEAMDARGSLFSEARLEETLYEYASMNPRSVGVGVRRALTDFTLDAEQSDDITMLALKYGVAPEKRAVMILPAVDTQLVHVYNFVHEELRRRNAPKSVQNPLDIAAEELFVNTCHYAYPDATPDNPGEVRISFEYEANPPSLAVEIADDGIPFDPLAKPDAVTPDDIAEVPIGGLGILMVKRCVDEISYRRENGSNIVTFRKGW